MTEGQFFVVTGALRELVELSGHPPEALDADEVTERLRMTLPNRDPNIFEVCRLEVIGPFDACSIARRIRDLYNQSNGE